MITHDTAWAFKPHIRRKFFKENQTCYPPPPPNIERLEAALKHTPKPRSRQSRDSEGFIYFFKLNDFVKIGLATNPESRLSELQSSSPYDITILRCIRVSSMRFTEQAVHQHFHQYHHLREWFRIPPQELQCFLSLPDDQIDRMGHDFQVNQSVELLKNSLV